MNEHGGVGSCPARRIHGKGDACMGTSPRTPPLTGKDMRPDFYDDLSPEAREFWDAAEYDESIIPAGNVAILGGGPTKTEPKD